jgi:hypothetical protein
VVTPIGQIRLRTESDGAEAKKLQLDFKPNPGDDQFILKSEGLRVEPGKRDNTAVEAVSPTTGTPKGFLP